MIWCAFGTMVITLPISLVVENVYFLEGEVGRLGKVYFSLMMKTNFLFPLGAALASFFLGLGKTKLVAISTLFSHLLNIGLDYLLIFGLSPIIPSLGVVGAALATVIAQGSYCLLLLCIFLQRTYGTIYLTRRYFLHKKMFWESIAVALPRSLGKANVFLSWVAATWILSLKGDLFILILSVGNTLSLLFAPINEAIGQALLSLFSFFYGKKEWRYMWSTMRSAYLFLIATCIILSLPLVFFKKQCSVFLSNIVSM